jgi:hypothetical protein
MRGHQKVGREKFYPKTTFSDPVGGLQLGDRPLWRSGIDGFFPEGQTQTRTAFLGKCFPAASKQSVGADPSSQSRLRPFCDAQCTLISQSHSNPMNLLAQRMAARFSSFKTLGVIFSVCGCAQCCLRTYFAASGPLAALKLTDPFRKRMKEFTQKVADMKRTVFRPARDPSSWLFSPLGGLPK